jgi:Ras GTPase-activating-like protein IQGAP2/3
MILINITKIPFDQILSLTPSLFQAKLAASFAPSVVKLSKIFDLDERKYREMGLHFRHTDNINYFLTAAKFVGLPLVYNTNAF